MNILREMNSNAYFIEVSLMLLCDLKKTRIVV
jgi:hypothetical protein